MTIQALHEDRDMDMGTTEAQKENPLCVQLHADGSK